MLQTKLFQDRAREYDAWYEQYPEVFQSEVEAIRQQLLGLPKDIFGIEVGLGTGRFSHALGIKEGVEPVEEMAKLAVKRGIEIRPGLAERLPYKDLRFDFVLIITICHFDKVLAAMKEAHRVLKNDGSLILCFLDKDQAIAQSYLAKRERSHFYKNATFYTVNRVENMLKKAYFRNLEFSQTLFGELEDIDEIQSPKAGYGEGSFVVVKAEKKV